MIINIPSMACSACADTITKVVQNLDPHAKVKADLKAKIVEIEAKISEKEIEEAIALAGYPVA